MARRANRNRDGRARSAPDRQVVARSTPVAGPAVRTSSGSHLGVSPGLAFAALVAACLLIAVAYVSWAAIRTQSPLASAAPGVLPSQSEAPAGSEAPASAQPTPNGTTPPVAGQHLIFQNVARDTDYAKVAVVPLDDPQGPRVATDLTCERVYQAAGHGLCLVPDGGLITRYWAILFDGDYRERARIELVGSPSRARVSADGRYGATTVFVFGHSYADVAFSTQTTIIDMASATTIGELEQFSVYRGDTEIFSSDFNFWGVTFGADSNVFYATLRTAGQTYLVKGDIAAREVRIIHDNVECPSLSPDGTKIAFKKRVGELGEWRFTVLDLKTMVETPLAETESVDDQLEWMGDRQLIYGKAGSLWIVSSDGTGSPTLFVPDALSPSIGL